MKKLLILLLLAAPAWAATYSYTSTAAEEAVVTRARVDTNAIACKSVGLVATCTQAQADAVKPGAVTVYAANGPYLLSIIKKALGERKYEQDAADRAAFEAAKNAATQAQRDAMCQALGLAAGCLP